jgi:hypothetical protein
MVSAIDTLLHPIVVTSMIYHNFQAFSDVATPVRAIAELTAAALVHELPGQESRQG